MQKSQELLEWLIAIIAGSSLMAIFKFIRDSGFYQAFYLFEF